MSAEYILSKLNRNGIEKITVPKICSLLTDDKKQYNQTARFLNKIFSWQTKNILIDLNFEYCKAISLECCVILSAIVESYQKLNASGMKNSILKGNLPVNQKLIFLLNKLGFYKFTNANFNFDETGLFEKQFSLLPLDTGFLPENYMPENIDNKIRLLFPETLDIKVKTVFTAISEAILNIDDHAYLKNKHVPELLVHNKSRWFSGIRDLEKNTICLAIYDLGIGIPTRFRHYDTKFNSLKDAKIIETAMKKGITTSSEQGRGKGSENLKDILQSFNNSFLRIISQKGSYQIDNSGKIQLLNFDCPIKGTLLCWQICLN